MTNLESSPEEINHNSTTPVYIIYMSINTVNTDLEIKQHWIMQKSKIKSNPQNVCIAPLQLCCRKKQYEPGPKTHKKSIKCVVYF